MLKRPPPPPNSEPPPVVESSPKSVPNFQKPHRTQKVTLPLDETRLDKEETFTDTHTQAWALNAQSRCSRAGCAASNFESRLGEDETGGTVLARVRIWRVCVALNALDP